MWKGPETDHLPNSCQHVQVSFCNCGTQLFLGSTEILRALTVNFSTLRHRFFLGHIVNFTSLIKYGLCTSARNVRAAVSQQFKTKTNIAGVWQVRPAVCSLFNGCNDNSTQIIGIKTRIWATCLAPLPML